MRLGWLRGALLSRRAHPSVARFADDLFGAVAVALLDGLVSRRRLVHHRSVAVAAARLEPSAGRDGARSAGRNGAGPPRPRSPSRSAISRVNLLITPARRWRGPRLGRRAPGRSDFRVAAAVLVLAPQPRLARRGLLPLRQVLAIRRGLRRSVGLRARQPRRPTGPRSDPPRAAPSQIPQLVGPADRRSRARPLLGAGDDRRRALSRARRPRSRLSREAVVPTGGPGCQAGGPPQ